MKLSDATVRTLPLCEVGQRDYADETVPGFCVRVGKKTKTFMLTVGSGPARKRYTIGRYPALTLSKAREKAKDILAARRLSPAEPATTRFEAAVRTFFETQAVKNRASTIYEKRRLIERHFIPSLARRPLGAITTGEIVAVLDTLLSTPSEANHAYTAARTFFRWAARRRLIDRSPMETLDPPAPDIPRTRVLTPEELRAIWCATDALTGTYEPYGAFVKLLILTGQRAGQFAHLRGEMIDRKKQTITWPAQLMKGNREHTIPYGRFAATMVSKMPDIGLLFPTRAKTPFNNWANSKHALDALCPLPHWVLHDIRRTWSTISAEELGTEPHVIEAVLAHQTGTRVARIYNRARYLEPMRKTLLAFEDWLQIQLSETEDADAR